MFDETQADLQIGRPTFAINLIARPPEGLRNRLSRMQDLIDELAPEDCLHRCPAEALHLSVFQLIWSRSPNAAMNQIEWLNRERPTMEALTEIAAAAGSFMLSRGTVHVGAKAIFLRFGTSPQLELLRDGIEDFAASHFPDSNRPAIQHITLQRYRQSVSLSALQNACKAVPAFSAEWKVDRLELVQETIYPSLKTQACGTLRLR